MKKTWGEYIATIIFAVGLAFIVRQFVITAYKVPTGSMRPALLPGDFVFVNRLAFKFGQEMKRGDLVAIEGIQQTNISYLKRIIAIEGDRVEIRNGILYLNGSPAQYKKGLEGFQNPSPDLFDVVEESHSFGSFPLIVSKESGLKEFGPVVVPPGEVFLLGDNRDTSEDSRFWGTVSKDLIFGKVILIWMSVEVSKGPNGPSKMLRWDRILTSPR